MGEKPVFHAQIYKERFLGKIKPAINLEKMMEDGQPQYGAYRLPSTEE